MPGRTTAVEIAIPLPLEQTFHYLVPEQLAAAVAVGSRVLVPFGRRTVTGYILATIADDCPNATREISAVLDRQPLFGPAQLEFYRWIAAYYLHPIGEVIKTALPAGLTVLSRRQAVVAADGSTVSAEILAKPLHCRQENHYLPTGRPAPLALKGKAAAILHFLLQRNGASAPLVKGEFGSCREQLHRLGELGLIAVEQREVYRNPFDEEEPHKDRPHQLNEEQQTALDRIDRATDAAGFAPFLLHGITGSGKTEVYLQAISHALAKGRTAMVLVPEIALTPQLVGRFRRRFSCGIAVLHSALSPGERYDEWRRIKRGEATIVIGARSAIFAPLAGIGIIVVDEEHEATYKQSDGLRYNARDLALVLGKLAGATVILGSATPLVTTIHAAHCGKVTLLTLHNRVNCRPLPETSLIDLRGRKSGPLAAELVTAIGANLAAGGQTLLFLNRRGFATWLVCRDCGNVLHCPNCSVTLTYHQQKKRHICHYCDYSLPAPSVCPACDGGEIGLFGLGTERLAEEVAVLFPEARVARMDRDTTSGRGGHSRILRQVEKGEIDILIGTQMIAKGHDFPGVTLVGVLAPDTALNLPDFRGGERAFQLVSQVLGRAGRGDLPGRVYVQTMQPDHFALQTAVTHDFEAFYREELAQRQDVGYPPFAHLAALQFSGNAKAAVEAEARKAAARLRSIRERRRQRFEILGPATAPLSMVRGRHRWHILLKSPDRAALHSALREFKANANPAAGVRLAIDIDPLELL